MNHKRTRNAGASPARRTKRGSILVLVVAILAVLAALAVSYVTVVRVDRRSTDAYQEQENLQQQVGVVTAYLQSLIAADLYANRNVNSATPRQYQNQSDQPNWPKAFEDGEFMDMPWTDVAPKFGSSFTQGSTLTGAAYTWDFSGPNSDPSSNSWLRPLLGERAFGDDAWLAPIEPIDTGTIGGASDGPEWDTWTQITNLRSMYRYHNRLSQQNGTPIWTRDHGRYVDLGQFLLQDPPNFTSGDRPGYPGANLSLNSFQTGPWSDPTSNNQSNGPNLGVNQRIFDLQMADLQDVFYWPGSGGPAPQAGLRQLDPADERFWADADGDGRPDSRWQELDLLGNAYGLRWVVAARIIDNSGLVNVNSHLTFGYPQGTSGGLPPEEQYGDGRTPADVDFFRLLASQVYDARGLNPATGAVDFSAHPDVRSTTLFNYNQSGQVDSALERSWQLHLNRGLRVPNILEQLESLNGNQNFLLGESNDFLNVWPGGTLYGDPDSNPNPELIQPLDLKASERAHVWRYFGSNPNNPFASTGLSYPLRDDIDLRAYNGYNMLSYVSRLEQRIDGGAGAGNFGFLPGTGPLYTDFVNGPGLGAMRAKEWDLISESVRTFGNQFALLPAAGLYTNQLKLERLRKDIRHLLTTISGEGSIGPVPVLNPADAFDRVYLTRKVDLNRFTTTDFTIDPDRVREPLERAFEAFVWALAPLATNQALMSPLDQIDPMTYAQLARDADLHYGGGVNGPASAVAPLFGLNPNMPSTSDDIGAAYAVLRAASLAVNLVDAIDGESLPDMSEATTEKPTMARLFNQPDIDTFFGFNQSTLAEVNSVNAIPLGVRFPQGDITSSLGVIPPASDVLALPKEIVGDKDFGVTLVGLDRQPFLVQAYSAAVYADLGAVDPLVADSEIIPTVPQDQLGSILAVELGNPWPEPINIADYIVRITPDGAARIDIKFTDFVSGDAIILPGRSAVFYFVSDDPTAQLPAAIAEWQSIRDQLIDEIPETGDDLRQLDSNSIDAPKKEGVIFDSMSVTDAAPILLIRDIPSLSGSQILVDRLTVPSGGPNSGAFPATLEMPIDLLDFLNIPQVPVGGGIVPTATGRFAVQSRVYRKSANSASGFPAYVVERPEENVVQTDAGLIQAWQTTPNNSGPFPIDDLATDLITQLGGVIQKLNANSTDTGTLTLPNFELFVPNGPLFATSELGQICAFTHMYVHPSVSPPNVDDAWDVSGTYGPDAGSNHWATVSEQLGWDAHYYYDPMSAAAPNPYLGVLDPSRFILGVNGDLDAALTTVGTLLPDALAVPLATRVFDAFETLPTPDGVVRGRINVNTAPRRVIELLPMVDPRDPFNGFPLTNINGWNPSTSILTAQTTGDTRVDWLERYRRRDQDVPGTGLNNTSNDATPDIDGSARIRLDGYTALLGLRSPGAMAPWSLGLSSKGELASMALWNANGEVDGVSSAFLELGATASSSGAGPNDQAPLDVRRLTNGFEAQDDPEERLAIFRAISNIVSTRSDIFTAWFIIRAYDPKDIEAITIPSGMTNEAEIVSLMNPGNPLGLSNVSDENPGLLPAFERRVLVIFDRSNVQRPSDRPRVLLQVELPMN